MDLLLIIFSWLLLAFLSISLFYLVNYVECRLNKRIIRVSADMVQFMIIMSILAAPITVVMFTLILLFNIVYHYIIKQIMDRIIINGWTFTPNNLRKDRDN